MPVAKILTTDTYTVLYFDNVFLKYADNGIFDFGIHTDVDENFPEVYIPDTFYEKLTTTCTPLKTLFGEYKKPLLEMSNKYRNYCKS